MKFFKPSDFAGSGHEPFAQYAADEANAKLEREGKVVCGYESIKTWDQVKPDYSNTHKALLINIEPIEKCTHPSEKVGPYTSMDVLNNKAEHYFRCECGAKVKPKSYEVVE